MLTWIRVPADLARQPRTMRAANQMRWGRDQVVGFIVSLWSWAVEFSDDGNVGDYLPAFVDGGDNDSLCDTRIGEVLADVGFLDIRDGQYYLTDWQFLTAEKISARNEKDRQHQYYLARRQQKNTDSTDGQQKINVESTPNQCPIEEEEEGEEENNKRTLQNAEPDPAQNVPFSTIVNIFHNSCPGLAKVQKMTDARKKAIRARWTQDAHGSLEWFRELFSAVNRSAFLAGTNGRGWRADFDWILQPRNAARIMEGVYDNRAAPRADRPNMVPAAPVESERDEMARLLARNNRRAEG